MLQHTISDHKAALAEEEVDTLLQQLWEHKQALLQQRREANMELLLHFLHSSRWAWLWAKGGLEAGWNRTRVPPSPGATCLLIKLLFGVLPTSHQSSMCILQAG
jgi:hypothetical protein